MRTLGNSKLSGLTGPLSGVQLSHSSGEGGTGPVTPTNAITTDTITDFVTTDTITDYVLQG